jgi:hypothetical protein
MRAQERRRTGAERRRRRVARGLPAESATERARNQIRAAQREAANLAWLQEYKLARGCGDCGYNKHPVALEFDHLPGHEKVRGLSRMLISGRERLLAEIAKCDVVCANCHAIRTYNRRRESRLSWRSSWTSSVTMPSSYLLLKKSRLK